jgi:hypothetical protein
LSDKATINAKPQVSFDLPLCFKYAQRGIKEASITNVRFLAESIKSLNKQRMQNLLLQIENG